MEHAPGGRCTMLTSYFNYRIHWAESAWERRQFLSAWWRIYAKDPRWAPPWRPWLARCLGHFQAIPHLARMQPRFLWLEALPRRSAPAPSPDGQGRLASPTALFEEPVAASWLLRDPRRRDGAAYLALARCVNHRESLERLLDALEQELGPQGVRQLVGPVGLSPHLQAGVLQDYFHRIPPLHTPYNPPYLPELMDVLLRPLGRSQLFAARVPEQGPPPSGPGRIVPLEPTRLAEDLLPLLQAALPSWAGFPRPDRAEAQFLLEAWGCWPLDGYAVTVDEKGVEKPVGVLLLQPDLAPQVRRGMGGRHLLGRLWLAWRRGRPVQAGRVLLAGVLPEWRGQGLGSQLWRQALFLAREQGWMQLTIGPLPTAAPGGPFLRKRGAEPQGSYLLHRLEF